MPVSVECPTCGESVEWHEMSVYRPFCSERCRLIDLGAWASDRHVIQGAEFSEDDLLSMDIDSHH